MRTLHPKLYVARTVRALPAHPTSANLRPRYNIAPTTQIDVVRLADGARQLVPMRWGLIPGWWKKTVKEVPSTLTRLRPRPKNRCVRLAFAAPAASASLRLFEWRAVEGGKQPYFISAADGELLSIAGLWDERGDPETSETISSATLIVTAVNDFTRRIHDRMPVMPA